MSGTTTTQQATAAPAAPPTLPADGGTTGAPGAAAPSMTAPPAVPTGSSLRSELAKPGAIKRQQQELAKRIADLEASNAKTAAELASERAARAKEVADRQSEAKTNALKESFKKAGIADKYHAFVASELKDVDPETDAGKAKIDAYAKANTGFLEPSKAATPLAQPVGFPGPANQPGVKPARPSGRDFMPTDLAAHRRKR